jgi:hypothetical protein
MTQNQKSPTPKGLFAVIAWMIINIAVFALLIPRDSTDLNNYIEPLLLAVSIAGLLTMRKAGAAFATSVLCISLSTSMGIVLLDYYASQTSAITADALNELITAASINALRIALNIVAVIYMFRLIFANKFR